VLKRVAKALKTKKRKEKIKADFMKIETIFAQSYFFFSTLAMSLKTIVKVGNITNLSDARYCAGMNVDMLGFVTIETQKNYLPVKEYQDIRGWLSGPKVVAEVYGLQSKQQLDSIIEAYKPDYLELSHTELHFTDNRLPLLVRVSAGTSFKSLQTSAAIAFIIKAQEDGINPSENILLEAHDLKSVQHLIDNHSIKGIALSGSQEVSPGLKDYDHLAEILESLEVE
jgi:phosphoribosylanthranilate isomerase